MSKACIDPFYNVPEWHSNYHASAPPYGTSMLDEELLERATVGKRM